MGFVHEPKPMRDGSLGIKELATVRKRIGRDIHHTHQQRAVERQEESAAAQDPAQAPGLRRWQPARRRPVRRQAGGSAGRSATESWVAAAACRP